jgi:hypothetical protein
VYAWKLPIAMQETTLQGLNRLLKEIVLLKGTDLSVPHTPLNK